MLRKYSVKYFWLSDLELFSVKMKSRVVMFFVVVVVIVVLVMEIDCWYLLLKGRKRIIELKEKVWYLIIFFKDKLYVVFVSFFVGFYVFDGFILLNFWFFFKDNL